MEGKMSTLTLVFVLGGIGLMSFIGFMLIRGIMNERKEKQSKELKNEQKQK